MCNVNNNEAYSEMGERTKHRNIIGRWAFHVECTAFIHEFEGVANIWLEKFDLFLHIKSKGVLSRIL